MLYSEAVKDQAMDAAKDQAMDALDTSVVGDDIRELTLGRYYRVKGPVMGRYLLANEMEELDETPSAQDVLIKARSIA